MSAHFRKLNGSHSRFVLTREYLVKLKLKAVRRGCWFRDLKQNERMLLDLTINVVQRVRSFLLAKVLSRLVSRLVEAMESRIVRLMRGEGVRLAEQLSNIGVSWGLKSAQTWVRDWGFIQYITVNNLGVLGI